MKFVDPISGSEMEFRMIKVGKLKVGEFQRELSKPLIRNLMKSLTRGFVGVLLVTVREDGFYDVIDGQHRLEGVRTLKGADVELPCIVAPVQYNFQPLLFNIEKSDNTKDLATKIFREYEWFTLNKPDENEGNVFGVITLGRPHLISLAYGYSVCGLKSPSLVEGVTKKLDSFLDTNITAARIERVHRGQDLADLEQRVEELCQEYSIKDYNIKRSIISRASSKLWGRKHPDVSFNEGMGLLNETIDNTNYSWLEEV